MASHRALEVILAVCLLSCPAAAALELDGHGLPSPVHPLSLFNTGATTTEWDPAIFIRLNTTTLASSGQWVDAWFSGVSDPRYDDLLVLYSPADADPRKVSPLKYKFAAAAPGYIQLGEGHHSFRLLNLRQAQRVYLVRNGLAFPLFVAASEAIVPLNPGEPTQVHLALTGREGEMGVQWVSGPVAKPGVRWGSSPGQHRRWVAAASGTYTRDDMCGPPASTTGWLEPGLLHSAVLPDLVPGQRYYYQVGSEGGSWSEEASFLAAPGPEAEVQFLALADLGQTEADGSLEVDAISPASSATTDLLAAEAANSSLLILNGDLSYARGYAVQWETFFDQLAPVVRSMPFMTVPGNHERDWPHSGDRFPAVYDSGGECGVPYHHRTGMPVGSMDAPWYSFDHGPIHFLQYSTGEHGEFLDEHAFAPDSQQYAFIAADLAGVNRSRTPWVIVGGHRPMYIDSTFYSERPDSDHSMATALRAALEPLFLEHDVDVTWHGHHHSYQRTCPMAHGRCLGLDEDGTANGPVHLVIGHAGAVLTPNLETIRPEYFKSVQLRHGYLRVRANRTRLEQVAIFTADGTVMDRVVLTKPAGWSRRSGAAAGRGARGDSVAVA